MTVSAKCLLIAKSICQNTGPRTLLRGALPNGCEMSVGTTTVSRLNQLLMVCCPSAGYGSPAQVRTENVLAPEILRDAGHQAPPQAACT